MHILKKGIKNKRNLSMEGGSKKSGWVQESNLLFQKIKKGNVMEIDIQNRVVESLIIHICKCKEI